MAYSIYSKQPLLFLQKKSKAISKIFADRCKKSKTVATQSTININTSKKSVNAIIAPSLTIAKKSKPIAKIFADHCKKMSNPLQKK